MKERGNLVWIWKLCAPIVVGLVVFAQQYALSLHGQTLSRPVPSRVANEAVGEAGFSDLAILSQLLVQLTRTPEEFEYDEDEMFDELESLAVSRTDRLRVAIVAGELFGKDDATRRLDKLAQEAEPGGALATDLYWLKRLYTEGPDAIGADAQRSLAERHGWFGRLAGAFERDIGDSRRGGVVTGLEGLAASEAVMDLALGLGALAGVFVLVVLVRKAFDFEYVCAMDDSEAPDILLEMFVLFMGAFFFVALLDVLMFGMALDGTMTAVVVSEVGTWALLGVLAWPLVRRVPWSDLAGEIGLTTGNGVVREVGVGLLAFLASTTLLMGVHLVAGVLEQAIGIGRVEADPTGSPLFEPPAGGGWGGVAMSALGSVVWAPVLEELIFRGALFRWLRPHMHVWAAVIFSSLAFGLAHPYGIAGLVEVSLFGVMMAMVREWRGSLIAPMVAHALHNGLIVLGTIVFLSHFEPT